MKQKIIEIIQAGGLHWLIRRFDSQKDELIGCADAIRELNCQLKEENFRLHHLADDSADKAEQYNYTACDIVDMILDWQEESWRATIDGKLPTDRGMYESLTCDYLIGRICKKYPYYSIKTKGDGSQN